MVQLPRRLLLACFLPLGVALPAHADEADVFNFQASTNLLYDDNLFRASDRSGQKESDWINTNIVGVDFRKRVSLQEFVAHVSWVDTRYQNHDYLNAGALHYDGSWRWAVGSDLTGELGADRSAAQNSFADFRNLRERNLRTIENQHFTLKYAVEPSWHLLGGVSHQLVTNDHLLPQDADTETNGVNLGIRYLPSSGNSISFLSRRSEGKYTKRPFDPSPSVRFDNEFTETGQEIATTWKPTGHSAFNGRVGYLQRKHEHFSDRDMAGWTGQLDYLYQYSAKTGFTAAYLRTLNPFQDAVSSYYVADGLTLTSRWAATDKVTMSAHLGYALRKYRGEIVTLPRPRREDDVVRMGADVSYVPYRWLELKAGLVWEKRNSNYNTEDFTDRQAMLGASIQF